MMSHVVNLPENMQRDETPYRSWQRVLICSSAVLFEGKRPFLAQGKGLAVCWNLVINLSKVMLAAAKLHMNQNQIRYGEKKILLCK